MKIFLIIFLSIFWFIFNVYGQIYISEINFADNEYIEIYSDISLNLSEFILYDDGGVDKSNILESIKLVNDTKYFLIAGTNFINNNNNNNNNISNLNCSIYSNSKSELGYYGLKNTGENISLYSNITNISLNWNKNKEFNFNINETLSYDFISTSFYISSQSPCRISILTPSVLIIENISNKLNISNLSININSSENTSIFIEINNSTEGSLLNFNNTPIILNGNNCNYSFEIISTQDIFTDKLRYKFKTNATNFIIEYFIEDFGGNIVKSKKNTSSISEKSFTPDFSEVLNIKATLLTNENNCSLNTSKIVYFYSSKKQNNTHELKSVQKKLNEISYIQILNQKEIENFTSNILEYEVYRGNNSKRTGYIYYNGKKLSSFELEMYSKISGKIEFDKIFGNNSLVISGFDLENKVNFYPPEFNLIYNDSIFSVNDTKEKFVIVNVSLNNSQIIYFNIDSNFNYDSICHVYYDKTEVSKILNILNRSLNGTFNNEFSLELDILKISKKWAKIPNNTQTTTIELKLSCKYKKSELKTYKYYSYLFNYSLDDNLDLDLETIKDETNELKITNLVNKNQNYLNYTHNNKIVNYDTLSYFEKEESKINTIKTIQKISNDVNKTNSNEPSYISSNYNMKENSYFSIFLGSIIVLIVLITLW